MPFSSGRPWVVDCRLDIVIVALIMLIPAGALDCFEKDSTAYTSRSLTYKSSGYSTWTNSWGDPKGYRNNRCWEVEFKAYYDGDVIELTVTDSDIQPRDHSHDCVDKVTIYDDNRVEKVTMYDGSSTTDPVLGIFCGKETPVYESTGNLMLLVFETDGYNPRAYRGFSLEYVSLDRGGSDDDSSTVDTGIIVAAVIPAVIIYTILFVVVYKRHKYAQRVRQNLAVTGHRPEDLGMAMASLINQANRGPLTRSQAEALNNAIRDDSPPSEPRRVRGCRSVGRVRHPAGDIHTSPRVIEDTCSGYGSDREEGHRPASDGIVGNEQVLPGFHPDPSGVYYAGNVDEHGVLHPPGSHTQSTYLSAPTPSVASSGHSPNYLVHHLDDDRRSHGSSRSRRSERNSPRDGSHGRGSGNGSPYRNRVHNSSHGYSESPRSQGYLDTEGQTLTYYGMIDGDDGRGQGRHSGSLSGSAHPDNQALSAPPPSYEEAASGKYAPQYHQQD